MLWFASHSTDLSLRIGYILRLSVFSRNSEWISTYITRKFVLCQCTVATWLKIACLFWYFSEMLGLSDQWSFETSIHITNLYDRYPYITLLLTRGSSLDSLLEANHEKFFNWNENWVTSAGKSNHEQPEPTPYLRMLIPWLIA